MSEKAESRGLDRYSMPCMAHRDAPGSHFVVIVSRCHGEKTVHNLEVEMSSEPVIKGGLVDVACCLEMGGDPAPFPVVISAHGDMVHLCHPHKPAAFQEPDHEEKAREAFASNNGT